MSMWLDARVRDVRARIAAHDEGSLWVLFLDGTDGTVVMAVAFDQAMTSIDGEMTGNLRRLIDSIPAPAVLLAVPRRDGVPLNADQDLWHRLEAPWCNNAKPIDLVVVGVDSYWSARQSRSMPVRLSPMNNPLYLCE